ncbi:MAG: helix-turn-helix domain-containing protein [Syntrophomonadaceae bacterium]|jgi:hypothetical protein
MPHDKTGRGGSIPPWSRIPALQEMTREAGVDFEQFINLIQKQESVESMAAKLGVSEDTITSLQNHFFRYGLSSVCGGD